MNLYRYAWEDDGRFDTDGVVFRTFDDMAYGDAEELRHFVCDIVGSGNVIMDNAYYTYTTYGYRPANVDDLYEIANIAELADWLIDNVRYYFPVWLFCDMDDVESCYTVERYCLIIANHI